MRESECSLKIIFAICLNLTVHKACRLNIMDITCLLPRLSGGSSRLIHWSLCEENVAAFEFKSRIIDRNFFTSRCRSQSLKHPLITSHQQSKAMVSWKKPATSCESLGVGDVESQSDISGRWRELHGEKNWDHLLSPLDLQLRREILRYGDFAQVTEDGFPWEQKSRFPYACPHQKKELLHIVGQPESCYKVTRYLYSYLRGKEIKGPVQEVNWIGYVAVTVNPKEIKRLGRRDILVAWRGTKTTVEWGQVDLFEKIPITPINKEEAPKGVMVAEGFWHAFADEDENCRFLGKGSAGKQATEEVKRLLEKYAGEEMSITCVGHSLGGTLATYCAYQIAEDGINQTPSGTVPVTAITFASPRPGNTEFRDRFTSLGLKHLRIKVNQDIVPCFPVGLDSNSTPILVGVKELVIKTSKLIHLEDAFDYLVSKVEYAVKYDGYAHVGTTLSLNFKKSPYLKQPGGPEDVNNADVIGNHHNLQAHLHLVNGIVGTDGDLEKPFKLVVIRDLGLINKSADILADPHAECVPPKWWKMNHSGLVRNKKGVWVYPYLFDPAQECDENYD